VFWLVGDCARQHGGSYTYILGVLILFTVINIKLTWDLNLMKWGDDTAKSLGVEVDRTRTIV
jgi:iron complex transport system permease protein